MFAAVTPTTLVVTLPSAVISIVIAFPLHAFDFNFASFTPSSFNSVDNLVKKASVAPDPAPFDNVPPLNVPTNPVPSSALMLPLIMLL